MKTQPKPITILMADDDADDRSFPAPQAAPAQDRRGNAVEFEEIAVRRGRHGIGVEREQDPRHPRQQPGHHVTAGDHQPRVDPRVSRRQFVAPDRQ